MRPDRSEARDRGAEHLCLREVTGHVDAMLPPPASDRPESLVDRQGADLPGAPR